MIKRLSINNFKCFQDLRSFEFSKINLLTGINGRGKSSLLHSLLTLSQSAKSRNMSRLILNGDLINLGTFDDIKNSDTPRSEPIVFNFSINNPEGEFVNFHFDENLENPLIANCKKIETGNNEHTELLKPTDSNSILTGFLDLISRIHFISADRLGPVKYVDKLNIENDFIHVGTKGEYTVNILANSINMDNVNDLLYKGIDANSVIQQTIEWLGYILDGAKIDIKGKEKDSSILYMLINNKNNSFRYKPINVGFGYSYILPLIVSGLIAKQGDMLIVENPEAHLHPKAQSRIAEFFTKVASCGIQVFIESHSEHILNGIRVNCIRPGSDINHNDFCIHYFNEEFGSEKLNIDRKGKIANWPKGFFDQQEIDLGLIFQYSKP